MRGFDVDTTWSSSFEFLYPLGFQSKSEVAIGTAAGSINGHDLDVIHTVSRLVEVSRHRFITFMLGVTAVLKKTGF